MRLSNTLRRSRERKTVLTATKAISSTLTAAMWKAMLLREQPRVLQWARKRPLRLRTEAKSRRPSLLSMTTMRTTLICPTSCPSKEHRPQRLLPPQHQAELLLRSLSSRETLQMLGPTFLQVSNPRSARTITTTARASTRSQSTKLPHSPGKIVDNVHYKLGICELQNLILNQVSQEQTHA